MAEESRCGWIVEAKLNEAVEAWSGHDCAKGDCEKCPLKRHIFIHTEEDSLAIAIRLCSLVEALKYPPETPMRFDKN